MQQRFKSVSFLTELNAPLFCSKCGCCSTSSPRRYISAISTCLIVSLSVCRAAEASRERNAIVSFSKLSCSIILFFFSLVPQEDDGLRKRKVTSMAAPHTSTLVSSPMREEGLSTRVLALCVLFFVIGVIIGKLAL